MKFYIVEAVNPIYRRRRLAKILQHYRGLKKAKEQTVQQMRSHGDAIVADKHLSREGAARKVAAMRVLDQRRDSLEKRAGKVVFNRKRLLTRVGLRLARGRTNRFQDGPKNPLAKKL